MLGGTPAQELSQLEIIIISEFNNKLLNKISYFKLILRIQTKIFLLILQILLYYKNITNY